MFILYHFNLYTGYGHWKVVEMFVFRLAQFISYYRHVITCMAMVTKKLSCNNFEVELQEQCMEEERYLSSEELKSQINISFGSKNICNLKIESTKIIVGTHYPACACYVNFTGS